MTRHTSGHIDTRGRIFVQNCSLWLNFFSCTRGTNYLLIFSRQLSDAVFTTRWRLAARQTSPWICESNKESDGKEVISSRLGRFLNEEVRYSFLHSTRWWWWRQRWQIKLSIWRSFRYSEPDWRTISLHCSFKSDDVRGVFLSFADRNAISDSTHAKSHWNTLKISKSMLAVV